MNTEPECCDFCNEQKIAQLQLLNCIGPYEPLAILLQQRMPQRNYLVRQAVVYS